MSIYIRGLYLSFLTTRLRKHRSGAGFFLRAYLGKDIGSIVMGIVLMIFQFLDAECRVPSKLFYLLNRLGTVMVVRWYRLLASGSVVAVVRGRGKMTGLPVVRSWSCPSETDSCRLAVQVVRISFSYEVKTQTATSSAVCGQYRKHKSKKKKSIT